MLKIGIERHQGLVFEGDSNRGRLISPLPVVTPAKIVFESEGQFSAESAATELGWRFREDFYDPVSRIRRGRFYIADGNQPQRWIVPESPAFRPQMHQGFPIDIELETFSGRSIYHQFIKGRSEQPLVLLGVDDRFTIWTIINVEAISTGEDLVTMKARASLGLLPKVDFEKIPERHRDQVRQSLDTFMNEVYRSAPISVIDRARDAASQLLIAFFNRESHEAKDLGPLTDLLEGKDRAIAENAARIIARLHARGKPNEREKRKLPAIREQDAELAAQCLGTILCELGWAHWT